MGSELQAEACRRSMKTILNIPEQEYEALWLHLNPIEAVVEQAAFIFAAPQKTQQELTFEFLESELLCPSDFAKQEWSYLELLDETRARIIKRAHDLQASMIELHSHLCNWPAEFSGSDLLGFEDIVPHLWWRLNARPYGAIVVGGGSFDGLVWINDPGIPVSLDEIRVGKSSIFPTALTLKYLYE
jgi:hypothetical protein